MSGCGWQVAERLAGGGCSRPYVRVLSTMWTDLLVGAVAGGCCLWRAGSSSRAAQVRIAIWWQGGRCLVADRVAHRPPSLP